MIHAASRHALDEVRERFNAVLPTLGDASGSQAFASEIYSVSALLAAQPRLRRTLADPATSADARAELARSLLSGKVSGPVLDVTAAAVSQRWSSPWDLADALEIAGDEALLASAETAGTLDEVEDELFRFERILSDEGELTAALDEASVPADRRIGLLHTVLDGRASDTTIELLAHSVSSARKRSIELAIDDLLQASAARRDRTVARVITASAMTDEQTNRLSAALSSMYGRPISVRSAVDPSVRGGLVVRVGDEVIDGTVASRMAAARSVLAG